MRRPGAGDAGDEIWETWILQLVVNGRLKLTSHHRSIERAIDYGAIQLCAISTTTDDIQVVYLISIANAADHNLTTESDLRSVYFHVILNLRVGGQRSHWQCWQRHHCRSRTAGNDLPIR